MEGKTTNASNGASNKKKTVPTTQGKKEIGTKTNVDIADDLERYAGEGRTVAINYGMAEFKYPTRGEVEAAANSGSDGTTGDGKNSASELGPTGKVDTGMLVIALRNNEVATISVRDEKKKDKDDRATDNSDKDHEEK